MKARNSTIDKNGNRVRIGDKVRLTSIHPKVRDTKQFKTRTILRKALGRTFAVKGLQKEWIELHLGRLVGKRSWEETIWVEPEIFELVPQRGANSQAVLQRGPKKAHVVK